MVAERRKTLLVADLFCGAGGSSTGARRALESLGFRMDLLCVNHWPTAIETHKKNHPDARHYCQDVSTVRPHLVVPGRKLDLLMASPTCTFHSRARGGKPTSDQQRMDPWHVIAWLTDIRVRCLIIENVPEFVNWSPIDTRTGRPIPSRRGEYFEQWCDTIRRLGFKLEWRILNAADFGDATTRQRFFLLALSDGQIAARAGMSLSGTFDKYLSQQRTNGWVTGDRSALALTAEGLTALGNYEPLPTGAALREYWLGKVSGGKQREMLEVLFEAYPAYLKAEDVAAQAQMALSGTFDKYLSQLRTLLLVEGTRSALRANPELFEFD